MLCVLLGRSVAAVKPNSSLSLLSSILQSTTNSEKKQVRSRCWLNRNIFCVHKLLLPTPKSLKSFKKGGQIGTYIKKIWRTSWRRYSFRRWETFIFFFFFYCLTAFGDSVSSWLWQARLLPLASMIHVTLLSHTFEMMLKDGDVGIGSIYSIICWTQIFRRKRYFSHQI